MAPVDTGLVKKRILQYVLVVQQLCRYIRTLEVAQKHKSLQGKKLKEVKKLQSTKSNSNCTP